MLILLRDKYYSSPVVMDEDEYLERLFSKSRDIGYIAGAIRRGGNRRTYREVAKELLQRTSGDSNKALELLNSSKVPSPYEVFTGNTARALDKSLADAKRGIREAIKRAQKSGANLSGRGNKDAVLDYQKRASALSGSSRLSEEQARKAIQDSLRKDTTLGKEWSRWMDNNPEVDTIKRYLGQPKQYIPKKNR